MISTTFGNHSGDDRLLVHKHDRGKANPMCKDGSFKIRKLVVGWIHFPVICSSCSLNSIKSYHIISAHIVSYHTVSNHTISYNSISYHSISVQLYVCIYKYMIYYMFHQSGSRNVWKHQLGQPTHENSWKLGPASFTPLSQHAERWSISHDSGDPLQSRKSHALGAILVRRWTVKSRNPRKLRMSSSCWGTYVANYSLH